MSGENKCQSTKGLNKEIHKSFSRRNPGLNKKRIKFPQEGDSEQKGLK